MVSWWCVWLRVFSDRWPCERNEPKMVAGVFPAAKLGVLLMKQLSKPIANYVKENAKKHPFFRKHVCMPPAQCEYASWTKQSDVESLRHLASPGRTSWRNKPGLWWWPKTSNTKVWGIICAPLTIPTIIIVIVAVYNWCEVKMKMWIMNLGKPVEIPKLNEAMAIELGANLLGETIIFSIAAFLLYLEYARQVRKETAKEAARAEEMLNINTAIRVWKIRWKFENLELLGNVSNQDGFARLVTNPTISDVVVSGQLKP